MLGQIVSGRFKKSFYRCGTEVKISWFIEWVADSVYSERSKQEDIKVGTVKTGGSCISDVALTQLLVKKYVLGPWLDGMDCSARISHNW